MPTRKSKQHLQRKARFNDFDKYTYYTKAVQSPDTDVEFIHETFKTLRGRAPKVFREDFCGTFINSCEWVKMRPDHKAIGIDLDIEPLEYGKKTYLAKLKEPQQKRIQILREDVLSKDLPRADIIAAMNFSYYLFKKRAILKEYFLNALHGLRAEGMFILDCFGGSLCQVANVEVTEHKTFSYYWDQAKYDPITNEALFHIHFKRKGEANRERVFTYDWRMWTIPELRELLEEVGFQKTFVYWEGTTKSGEGDGKFTRTEVGEECEAWIAYIVALR